MTRLVALTLELYRVIVSVSEAAKSVDSEVIFPDIVLSVNSPETIVPTVSEPFSKPETLLSPIDIPFDAEKVMAVDEENCIVPVDVMDTDDCPLKSKVESDITP
jgi:hypothetical protein